MRIDPDLLKQCWFLTGPTACGKSGTGIELAERLGAEIVSMDSMALYRGMDIGTDKPSPSMQRRISHHLIDILDPHERFSVAEYLAASERACQGILKRRHVPLFLGGTGLYLRSLLRGVFDGPPADWELRRRLEQEARVQGPGYLHRALERVDPATAASLHPNDTRRVTRALEVYHLTGTPLSQQRQEGPLEPQDRPQRVFWLAPPRDWLYDRINRRVHLMISDGLIEEVRRLRRQTPSLSRTAQQALGYKEVSDALEAAGERDLTALDLARLIDRIQTRTRQLAKRQFTWFRNLVECQPIAVTGSESPGELTTAVLEAGGHLDG